ncbi:MAG TPA: cytochrome c-type biogenesis protein CcmH [Actinomycetota bacterium]|nr:cytochrome c-type biogenesis protein CcmH [Actinomycetota bacterium]
MRRDASSSRPRHRLGPRLALTVLLVAGWSIVLEIDAPHDHAHHAMAQTPTMAADPSMQPLPSDAVIVEGRNPRVDSVLKQLMCRCGCNLTVYACERSMVCEVAAAMRDEAEGRLRSGMTINATLAAFVADYGEVVLAAPTKEGFNLTAWILPFVALLFGLAVVVVAVRSWRGGPTDEEVALPTVDDRYASAIEDEVSRED